MLYSPGDERALGREVRTTVCVLEVHVAIAKTGAVDTMSANLRRRHLAVRQEGLVQVLLRHVFVQVCGAGGAGGSSAVGGRTERAGGGGDGRAHRARVACAGDAPPTYSAVPCVAPPAPDFFSSALPAEGAEAPCIEAIVTGWSAGGVARRGF